MPLKTKDSRWRRPPEFWAFPTALYMGVTARSMAAWSILTGAFEALWGCKLRFLLPILSWFSGTAFRNSGSTSASQLGVQPRFDLGFRNGGVLPAQLGKLDIYLRA